MQENYLSHHQKKIILVHPPIPRLFTMSLNKSYMITSHKEWKNPGRYRHPLTSLSPTRLFEQMETMLSFKTCTSKTSISYPQDNAKSQATQNQLNLKIQEHPKVHVLHWRFSQHQQSCLLLVQWIILLYSTQEMSSKSPLRTKLATPIFCTWYPSNILNSTNKFCQAMFKEDDNSHRGMVDRSATLKNLAYIEINRWILCKDNCEQQNIPIPKCLWFHKFRSGYYDLALEHLNKSPKPQHTPSLNDIESTLTIPTPLNIAKNSSSLSPPAVSTMHLPLA